MTTQPTQPKQITVTENSGVKDGANGKWLTIKDQEGNKYSCFQTECFPYLNKGDSILINWFTKGQYKNIQSVDPTHYKKAEVIPVTPPPVAPQSKTVPVNTGLAAKLAVTSLVASGGNREASIDAAVAFKGLVELDVAGKLPDNMHLLIVAWAMDKMGIVPVTK